MKKRRVGKWQSRSTRLVAVGTLAVSAVAVNGSGLWAEPGGFGGAHDSRDQPGQTPATVFAIGAGSLKDVLAAWQKAAGVSLAVHMPAEAIAGFESKGVRGTLTREEALRAILDGTGLGYHFERGGTRVEIQVQNAEQVSVTATTNSVALGNFTEALVDTPQTVNVVPQYILQEQAVTTLRDGLRNAPGISLAAGEGGSQGDNLTIRGFSARNDIFLDGIRDFGSYYRDAFDYESIDVLQGPASVEFGRGSTGGVVNQETKQAVANEFVRTNVQVGTDALRRGTVDMNVPLHEYLPNAAFRLNAVGEESGVAERDVTQLRRVGVAPSLSFGLGQATRLTVSYLHEFEDSIPDYGLPYYAAGVPAVNRAAYFGFRHANYLTTQPDVLSGRLEHDINAHWSVRSTLRFGYYPRDVRITEPQINTTATVAGVGAAVNGVYASYTATCAPASSPTMSCYPRNTPLAQVSVLRNQIAAKSVEDILWERTEAVGHFRIGGIDNDLALGIEGGRERSNPLRRRYTLPNATQYTNALDPNPDDVFEPTATTVSGLTHVSSQSYGVNFLDTLKLRQWLFVSGGVRFDYFNTFSQAAAIAPATTTTTLSHLDRKPTYRAAVVVKPRQNGSVYFDYGTSFNPSAESLSLSANTATSPPEENTTYEVGAKWEFLNGKLDLNGSLFRTEKLNARETDPTNSLNSILAGTQLVRGVQIGAIGHMPHHMDVIAGYAYLDGRLESSILNASPFASINQAFYTAALKVNPKDPLSVIDARYGTAPYFVSPNSFPFANVPKNSGNVWVTHDLPLRFVGGFGGNYVAARRASSTSVIGLYDGPAAVDVRDVSFAFKSIPDYITFNAMVRRSVTDRLELQANIVNLTNKFYIDSPHPNHLVPGEGRNAQFTVNYHF